MGFSDILSPLFQSGNDKYSLERTGNLSQYQLDPGRGRYYGDGGEMNTPELQAEISRRQVQLFDSHFQPYEEEMFDLANNESYPDQTARRSHDLAKARATSGPSLGQAQRQVQRYGARMAPRDTHRGEQQRGLMAAASGAEAANEARQQAESHQVGVGQDLGKIGQQLGERASRNVGDSADMWRERERQYQQMKAEAKGEGGLLGLGVGPL